VLKVKEDFFYARTTKSALKLSAGVRLLLRRGQG